MEEYPEQRLKSKVILITGAGSGIGRASAIRMAKEGAKILVNDIDQGKINEVVNTIKSFRGEALGYLADVTKKAEVEAMVEQAHEKFGKIDILFANAGIGADYVKITRMKEEFWDKIFEINAKGVFLVTQAVVKKMVKYQVPEDKLRGKIIITSSRAGKDGQEELSAYSASKGALIQFKTALAKELGPKNITVNAICPGTVLTPIYGPDVNRENIAGIDGKVALPLKKGILDPEDIAGVVAFLASNDSDFINGQAINICGGTIFH
ncbi:MAG TPA: SDR family oxidoreductase [Candidatus Deferrimicrobium sp.]|nr:SDR family oxidoreductase [Candidatus Deferrimicrobium sp.]